DVYKRQVINGVHFGKRWKHMVRNAQQSLKKRGVINYDGRRWFLTTVAPDNISGNQTIYPFSP
ncbi:MAG: hypothetical protein N2559_01805, partial [Anaerolineae bacterium]|nr:hypothetical protein [Anaerolineae bacterium]